MWSDKCIRMQPIYCSHLRSEWKKIGQYVTNMAGKDRCAQQMQRWIASFLGRCVPGVPEAPLIKLCWAERNVSCFSHFANTHTNTPYGVLHPKEEMIHTTKPPAIETVKRFRYKTPLPGRHEPPNERTNERKQTEKKMKVKFHPRRAPLSPSPHRPRTARGGGRNIKTRNIETWANPGPIRIGWASSAWKRSPEANGFADYYVTRLVVCVCVRTLKGVERGG